MKKTILSTLVILVTLSTSILPLSASTITPNTKSYITTKGEFIFDEIIYQNDSSKVENIQLTVSAYNPKDEKTLTDKPFITLKQNKFSVKAKSDIDISYIASIPTDTPDGTYFNVVFINKTDKQKGESNVTIVPSIGVLFTFHVQESGVSISQIFYNQSDITLEVSKKGLPYLFPTEFEYKYTNNSNFVFKPSGEIRVLDSEGNQIIERFEINKEEKAIYPGESFTQSYSINLWDDPKSITKEINIMSKTFSDIDQTPVLNKVTISILYQVIIVAVVVLIVVLTTLTVIVTNIKQSVNKKKTKVPKE